MTLNFAKSIIIVHVIEFKEVLRTVLISCLFIILGARISLDDLMMVWKEAVLFLLILIVIVRPASVFISMIGEKRVGTREKVFLSFMAPRGIVAAAVSSVFALELAKTTGIYAEEAARIVPITYVVIVGTVAFYGLLSAPLARRLGVALKNPQGVLFIGIREWTIDAAKIIQDAGFRVLMMDSNYGATRDARMAGVPALNANVLSDFAAEEIDLVGIGNMVAATPNDQVNTLACISLGHTLGNSNVFQIKPVDVEESDRKSSTTEFNGRPLGDHPVNSFEIGSMLEKGAKVKKTTLNSEFTMTHFREYYGESAIILFRISQGRELDVQTPNSNSPVPGDQLISLVIDEKSGTGPIAPEDEEVDPSGKLP